MLGLGVGIDYALFIVTRYRRGLADGLAPREAVVTALATSGRAVLFAGGTVVISLLGLFLVGQAYIIGTSAGAIFAVLLVLIGSLTLLPALLGYAGNSIDRFRVRRVRTRIGPRQPPLLVSVEPGGPAPSLAVGAERDWWSWPSSPSRCSRCVWRSPTPGTTRPRSPPGRPTTCWPRGSAPGSTGRLMVAAALSGGTGPATVDRLAADIRRRPGRGLGSSPPEFNRPTARRRSSW